MASRRRQRQYAIGLSVLVHGAIAVALIFSIPLAGRHRPAGTPNVIPIDTIMVDSAALDAEIARIDAEEQAAVRRQAEEEAARQEEIRRQQEELDRVRREREQEAARLEAEQKAADEARVAREVAEEQRLAREAEEARIEAERQARLEAERKAAEEARRIAEQKAAEEARIAAEREAARRQAVQDEIDRAIAAEQAARAARDSGLRDQWALAIGRKVELYWNRPPNVDTNLECVLVVTQLPDGSVTQVTVERCNTSDQNIIRSVENAVLNASPLPQRPTGVPFERQIRITFIPTE